MLASILIVYTKDENVTKDPKHQFGNINRPHKDGELAKQGVLADAFTGEHVKTKSPKSCQQDQRFLQFNTCDLQFHSQDQHR